MSTAPIEPKDATPALISRRKALCAAGAALTLPLLGCSGSSGSDSTSSATDSGDSDSDSSGSDTSGDSSTTTESGSCVIIPEETAGPYPLLAILTNSSIVRQDITENKEGVPLTLVLKLQDVDNQCVAISGAAVYVWHCDKDGEYSGYNSEQNGGDHSGETWLRGVQVSDSEGQVIFYTIYPGWYTGRITHIHFQIYLNDNLTVTATATSQLGFDQDITEAVYDSELYAEHGQNTSVTSFSEDNVFSDGTDYQIATVEGDVEDGYTATLVVGIASS